MLQKLEALLIMTDGDHLFLVSGSGEVIEPDDGILAIGSGGNYALPQLALCVRCRIYRRGKLRNGHSMWRRISAYIRIIM